MARKIISLIIVLAALALIANGIFSNQEKKKAALNSPASIIESPGLNPKADIVLKETGKPAAPAAAQGIAEKEAQIIAAVPAETGKITEPAAREVTAAAPLKPAETVTVAAQITPGAKETATAAKAEEKLPLAPDFTLPTYDGKTLTLSDLKGKRGVMLVFFATWCPACMAEVEQVKAFVETSRDKNVLVYAISDQAKDKIDKFIRDRKINYRVLHDQDWKVGTLYGARGIPLNVGIDAAGVVQYYSHRFPEDTELLIKVLTDPLRTGK